MDSFTIAVGSAFWLGILSSISPCPLASNIAAISYIGGRLDSPRKVAAAGLIYTFGRTVTYLVLGVLIVFSLLSIPELARFLQQNMNKVLGPILIIVGLFLLNLIAFSWPGGAIGTSIQGKVDRFGIWGAGLLGLLFALSFCPVSAALFFGSLIPLAIEHQSSVMMPTAFGIGTGLPVIVFAIVLSVSSRLVGVMFQKLKTFERWARRITGGVFLLVGTYYTLVYIFGVTLFN